MAISTAVGASAVAREVGIKTQFKNLRENGILYLPQRIAVIGQGSTASTYSTDKAQFTSAFEAGSTYGFGSPIHLAVQQLLPLNGDGIGTIPLTVYPLEDAGSGVASSGDITPSGSQTLAASYKVVINEIESESFVISVGDSVATIVAAMVEAINAVIDMPVIASDGTTKVDLVAKWAGSSSNDIYIAIDGSTTAGTSFAITQPTGGLVNPDIDDALNQIGDVWETMILNCMEIADTDTLDKIFTFGDGRWGALTKKPLLAFTGNTATTVTNAITVSDSRKTDRVNSQLVLPSSNELPFIVAARELSRIAVIANDNPPRDYGSLEVTGLEPGADGDQWQYTDRDVAVKGGSSTIKVSDGVPYLSDTVTFYHPTGDPTPAYRYVCDIVKLQQVIYNLDLTFNTPEWDGAPLIPDDQPTTNKSAKKPQMAKTAIAGIIDSLALNAIISDPEYSKKSIQVEIDSGNPKRLNFAFTVKLSGNTNITSIDLNFGFYFGTSAIVA